MFEHVCNCRVLGLEQFTWPCVLPTFLSSLSISSSIARLLNSVNSGICPLVKHRLTCSKSIILWWPYKYSAVPLALNTQSSFRLCHERFVLILSRKNNANSSATVNPLQMTIFFTLRSFSEKWTRHLKLGLKLGGNGSLVVYTGGNMNEFSITIFLALVVIKRIR